MRANAGQLQTSADTLWLRALDEEYAQLHHHSIALLEKIAPDALYRSLRASSLEAAATFPTASCGEQILRSAAAIEQTFNGLTANLWDDPFEWTLPETLATPRLIAEYLREVEVTRRRGFQLFTSDADLSKNIVAPSGDVISLSAMLLRTLARAVHHQGQAVAIFKFFSAAALPQV